MSTTIVIPVYNRVAGLLATLDGLVAVAPSVVRGSVPEIIVVDDGSTEDVTGTVENSAAWGRFIVHVLRIEREGGWRNPGRAQNVGLRLSRSDVTLICHSGIVPMTPHIVETLTERIMDKPFGAHVARITEGYDEVPGSQRDYFLFGGMLTECLQEIRGYDEDFTHYGYEDDDLANRLRLVGRDFFHHRDLLANHIPHDRGAYYGEGMERMRRLHYEKMAQLQSQEIGVVRNLNREWGAL